MIGADPALTPRERWAATTIDRQRVVIDALARRAGAATDAGEHCLGWLAVEGLAPRYVRYLAPWVRGAGFDAALPHVEAHRQALASLARRATAEVSRHDEATVRSARARLGRRVAFVGKGGTGKTFVAATLARALARRGRQVLAADLDTNPGMAFSLGLPPTEAGLPAEAVEAHPAANYGWQLAGGLDPATVVDRYATQGPDGVRYLGVGKISSVDKAAAKRSVAAVIQVLVGFGVPGWDVIGDLEAGPTTPFERYHAFADDVLVVVNPSWRSAMTARRLLPLVPGCRARVTANRWGGEADHPGLEAWARIPFDPEVAAAERASVAPIDACPRAPAVRAVEKLAGRLVAGEAGG